MNGSSSFENGETSDILSTDMEATGYKVFNDSVHGHITLHPLLVRVVDTPEFQRLRNLKQVGVAYYVYPGAGHCRYEHSLGTCYLAGEMVQKLMSREAKRRSPEEKERLTLCVQLAALCHDLGHGAFSHTWEAVVDQWGDKWKHESASCEVFEYLVEKNQLTAEFKSCGLEAKERNLVKQLIMGGPSNGEKPLVPPEDNFLFEIVSNKETGIDVDKWDYFLRDGLHLNLKITFNYRRLLAFCCVSAPGDDPLGYTHLSFRDKEIMNLYDMYRVRSSLHHTAYRHRVVLNIELMFIDAFRMAGDAGYRLNNNILLKDAHKQPDWLSQLSDHVFYDIVYSQDPAVSEAQNLFRRIMCRDLYTFVGKAHVLLPSTNRQAHIGREKQRLEHELKQQLSETRVTFRVAMFYLDLDSQHDPVSKVKFYKKIRGSNVIEAVRFQDIRDLLEPFPFQLTKETTAQLLVFSTEILPEQVLDKAKGIIGTFSNN